MEAAGQPGAKEEVLAREIEEGRIPAILGYIPLLCFIPLLGVKNNSFAKKHGKQGLLLLSVEIIALLFLIDAFGNFFWSLVLFIFFIFALLGILIYTLQGKYWKIPLLGDILEKYVT